MDRNDISYLLQFRDYTEANRVLEHLQRLSPGSEVTLGRYRVYYGGSPYEVNRAYTGDLKVLPLF